MMGRDEDSFFYAPSPLMSRENLRRAWKERPISTFVATGAGIGMIPVAPGTWGSAEGLLIAALLARARPGDTGLFPILAAALVILAVGVVASGRVEALSESRDPGAIVVDEVGGQMIAAAPCALPGAGGFLWAAAFLLFRLFDVWKPGPIRKLQELPRGWGIAADDVAAGIVAAAITYGIGRIG